MASPIKFQFEANSDPVVQAINGLSNQMQSLSKESAEWTKIIAWDSILSMIGRVKGAVGELATTLTQAFIQPAVEIENVSASLGVLMHNSYAADEVTAALQRMATNGVISFEQLHQAARPLTNIFTAPADISKWVGVFADIAAGSKVPAERLANMVARMQDMGKVEFTELANAGIPIFEALGDITGHTREELIKLGAEGKISTEQLLAAFESLTAEGGPFHQMNTTLSNTTGGSFDTLAASWQEVMAEVGKGLNTILRPALQLMSTILQECKGFFVSLTRSATVFGVMWASLKGFSLAKQLYSAVTAMTALNAGAKGLLATFRSIGKVGWMLAITGAVEALTYLYEVFNSPQKEKEAEQARIEAEWKKIREQEAKVEAKKKEEERSKAEQAEKDKEDYHRIREGLDKAQSVEELEGMMQQLREIDARQGKNVAFPWEAWAAHAMPIVQQRESQRKLQELEQRRFKSEQEGRTKSLANTFKGKTAAEQNSFMTERMWDLGLSGAGGPEEMRKTLRDGLATAAQKGDEQLYNNILEIMPLLDIWAETIKKEKEASDKAAAEAEAVAEGLRKSKSEALKAYSHETSLLSAHASGDTAAVQKLEQQKEIEDLTAKYQAAGFDQATAQGMATRFVKLKAAASSGGDDVSGRGIQTVASSLAGVGGGGVAHRLGDAQLKVSRQQLGTLGEIRNIVNNIASKATGIPVVA